MPNTKSFLTPWRIIAGLIFAAGARGDTAEQDLLKSAGERRMYTVPDYAPWSHALSPVKGRLNSGLPSFPGVAPALSAVEIRSA